MDDEGYFDSAAASAGSGARLSVVCPPNSTEAESLRVAVPGKAWRVVKVSVPPGVTPGNRFNVDLPPNMPVDHGLLVLGGAGGQQRLCLQGDGMQEGGWRRKRGLVVAALP